MQGQPPAAGEAANGPGMTLDQNLKAQNTSNQARQLDRLQQRYNVAPSQGVPAATAP
jgi:hypothetical protein